MIRPLEHEEIACAARTLAASFDDDPLFCYMLPKPGRRRRWLELIMTAALTAPFPEGHVVTTDDGPEGGAMALIPPGRYPLPSGRVRRAVMRARMLPTLATPTYRLLRGGIGMLNAMEAMHITAPHYYLQVIGVHPEAKGRGIGGALVRHVAELADTDTVPVYLETSNQINLGFYRRFGFEVVEEFRCPGGGPLNWTMMRPAAESSW